MNTEILDHLKTLRVGVKATKIIDKLLKEVEAKESKIVDHASQEVMFTSMIDKQVYQAMNGGIYGVYMEMRNDGGEAIAKQILLEEGIPQRLTGNQRKYLHLMDKFINERTSTRI